MPDLEPRVKVCRQPLAYGSAQLLGFAELVIGGAFVIRDIRILKVAKEGEESVFVAFPSRRWHNGGNGDGEEKKYYDVAFPITSASYREATGAIMKAFEEASAKA
ncbi:MAG: septation protein SpoVG family protein [Elusimicrobia bacterium]|nr:septation protein SpoVG family protein [Elusimicrobiota bacterium]